MADEHKPTETKSSNVRAESSDKPSGFDQKMKTFLGAVLGIMGIGLVISMFTTPTKQSKTTDTPRPIEQTVSTAKFSDQVQFEQNRLAAERMKRAMGQGGSVTDTTSQPVTDAEWEKKEMVRALSSRTSGFGLKEAHKSEAQVAGLAQGVNPQLLQQGAPAFQNLPYQQPMIPTQQPATLGQLTSSGLPGDTIVGRAVDDRFAGWRRGDELLLPTGSKVDAVLDQDVNSDYIGPWQGHLAQDVYSVDNQFILLPKGTQVFGKSNHITNVNEPIQNRMGLTVEWAILPNGKRIDFSKHMPVDQEGIAAYSGDVNRHLLAQFAGIAAYALISASAPPDDVNQYGQTMHPTFKGQFGNGFRDAALPMVMKYLSLVPTVTVRAGTPIKVIIQDDMYVRPWARVNTTVY